MSHENLIDQFLRESGMAASTLATLSGINRTKMSLCLRGQDHFSGPEARLLSDLILEIRGILSDLQPAPINLADCAALQRLIAYKREQIRWKAVAVDGEPEDQHNQQG